MYCLKIKQSPKLFDVDCELTYVVGLVSSIKVESFVLFNCHGTFRWCFTASSAFVNGVECCDAKFHLQNTEHYAFVQQTVVYV